MNPVSEVSSSLRKLYQWLSRTPWESFDPYDYGGSSLARSLLTIPNLALLLHRSLLLFPRSARILLGIRPMGTASGYAYLLSGFSLLGGTPNYPDAAINARRAYERLMSFRLPGGAWGLPFDWLSSGSVRIPKNVTLSYTAYTGLEALLHYYGLCGSDEIILQALDIARMTVRELKQIPTEHGAILTYSRQDEHEVINTNSLLGSMFCRLGVIANDEGLLSLGHDMLSFVRSEQNPDGSWNYFSRRRSRAPRIDNYHTAMTLRGILEGAICTKDAEAWSPAIRKGMGFYARTFMDPLYRLSVWPGRSYPKDIACLAEGILLYETVMRYFPLSPGDADEQLRALYKWGIRLMQNTDGSFFYRKYPIFSVDLRSIRWGQGMMLMALATSFKRLCRDR